MAQVSTYAGPIVSGALHLGLLAYAFAPDYPEPIAPIDSGPPVEVELLSLEEYNAALSKPERGAPDEAEPELAMNVPVPAARPPEGVTLAAPEEAETAEAAPEPEAPSPSESIASIAPPAPRVDPRALQDTPVTAADILPPQNSVRVVTAPDAPKQPRGVFDAPDIETDPDEPPEQQQVEEPEANPPSSTDVAESTVPRREVPPKNAPLPRPKPRGSLAVLEDEEDATPPPATGSEAGEGEEAATQSAEAEAERDRKLLEELAARSQAAEEKARALAEEEARIAAEDARIAAEEEAERLAEEKRAAEEALAAAREAEEEEREKAEAERLAKLEEEERKAEEERLAAQKALEEEKKRQEEDAARLAALEEEKRLKEEAALKALEEEKRRMAEELARQREQEDLARAAAELERQRLDQERVLQEQARLAQEALERERRAAQAAYEQEQRRLALQQLNAQSNLNQQTQRTLGIGSPTPNAPPPPADPLMSMLSGAVPGGASGGSFDSRTFSRNVAAQRNAPPLTQGERQRMLAQLANCWRLAGISGAAGPIVEVRAQMTRDGRVSNVTLLSSGGASPIDVERAMNALRDQRCQPYPLPPEKYASWQQIDIRFDPSRMMPQ